jgi:hypothetical protein
VGGEEVRGRLTATQISDLGGDAVQLESQVRRHGHLGPKRLKALEEDP